MEQNLESANPARVNEINSIAQTCASVLSSIVGTMCSAANQQEISLEDIQLAQGVCVITLSGQLEEQHALMLPVDLQSRLLNKLVGEDAASGFETTDPAIKGALREVVTQLAAAWAQHYSDTLGAEVGADAIDVPENVPDARTLGAGDPVGVRFDLSIGSDSYPIYMVVSSRIFGGARVKDTAGPEIIDEAQAAEMPSHGYAKSAAPPKIPEVTYEPVKFRDLAVGEPVEKGNLELLLDVPLAITVELGRAKTNIKSILGYGQGSLLTLDKLAGEQVDLLVNGKPFARGEVVVVDENFGVRITSILTPEERVQQLINE